MKFNDVGELVGKDALLDKALQPPEGSPELAAFVDELITWQETVRGTKPITVPHVAHSLPPSYFGEDTPSAEARVRDAFRILIRTGLLTTLREKAQAAGGDWYPQYEFTE